MVPHSLRVAEIFTVILGFGLATIAISARIYTKLRVVRNFLLEDCKPTLIAENLCLSSIDVEQISQSPHMYVGATHPCIRVPVHTWKERLMLITQLGFLAYLGLAIIIGRNGGDVEHKAYVRLTGSFLLRFLLLVTTTD